MNVYAVSDLEATLQKADRWLEGIAQHLRTDDPDLAHLALRVCLQAIRDRITPDEAADFAAQLPTLIRGIFYEGWTPTRTPRRIRDVDEFLALLREGLDSRDLDPAAAFAAVTAVIGEQMDAGVVAHARQMFPAELQELWRAG